MRSDSDWVLQNESDGCPESTHSLQQIQDLDTAQSIDGPARGNFLYSAVLETGVVRTVASGAGSDGGSRVAFLPYQPC